VTYTRLDGYPCCLRSQQWSIGWDWAPRLVTRGIWRHLRARSLERKSVVDMRVAQYHAADGTVALKVYPELAHARSDRSFPRARFRSTARWSAKIEEQKCGIEIAPLVAAKGRNTTLYHVQLELWRGDRRLDRWSRRIGLRTIELERKRDRWGESFSIRRQRPADFRKGRQLDSRAQLRRRSDARGLPTAAAIRRGRPNMNMLRGVLGRRYLRA